MITIKFITLQKFANSRNFRHVVLSEICSFYFFVNSSQFLIFVNFAKSKQFEIFVTVYWIFSLRFSIHCEVQRKIFISTTRFALMS